MYALEPLFIFFGDILCNQPAEVGGMLTHDRMFQIMCQVGVYFIDAGFNRFDQTASAHNGGKGVYINARFL